MAAGEWPSRCLSVRQIAAIEQVMALFVEDDLARGITQDLETFCHGCRERRSMPGFIRYETYQLCNPCATHFEVAQAQAEVRSVQQFLLQGRVGAQIEPMTVPA